MNTNSSILYLVPDLIGQPGGIARYCKMLCHAILNRGAKLEVIALVDSKQSQSIAIQLFPRMNYKACNNVRYQFVLQACKAVLQRPPDIILVGHINFAPLGWLLAQLSGARMITFIYGVDAWHSLPYVRRWPLLHSNQVISISYFTARKAVEANRLEDTKIRILWNCLDPCLEDKGQNKLASNELIMLTVARISEAERYKGHANVIRALPYILKYFPNVIYSIVGDGNGRLNLEELAAQLEVTHAVRFHGIVSDAELRQHYSQASFFIMPSNREGFGFVFLEAMAHGLPVIGGNVDATPEVVVDGETGLLVNPMSVEEIADAASRLLGDAELRKKMGQAGIRHVQQKFSFAQFQQTLCDHLSELEVSSQ